jgi:hypothetical protein
MSINPLKWYRLPKFGGLAHGLYSELISYKPCIYLTNILSYIYDRYINLTITIQHNTVEYLTLNFHPKGESTALKLYCHYLKNMYLLSNGGG